MGRLPCVAIWITQLSVLHLLLFSLLRLLLPLLLPFHFSITRGRDEKPKPSRGADIVICHI